jgi:hypothetical protein
MENTPCMNDQDQQIVFCGNRALQLIRQKKCVKCDVRQENLIEIVRGNMLGYLDTFPGKKTGKTRRGDETSCGGRCRKNIRNALQ